MPQNAEQIQSKSENKKELSLYWKKDVKMMERYMVIQHYDKRRPEWGFESGR